MIVKSGRKYIVENGFNNNSITKIIFGDSDEVSEEDDTINELGNELKFINTKIKPGEQNENINNDYFICQYEKKGNIIIYTTLKYNIHLSKTIDNAPLKISCMGLFNGDTLIARVVFPPIYKKNETELNLTYTLYF